MDNRSQNEANDQHSTFTGTFTNTFHGPHAGQNSSFCHSLKNRQSHSWHSGFSCFFNNSTRPSSDMHSGEQAWKTPDLDLSIGSLGDMMAFTSPDELVKTFTSLTSPGNLSFSRETFGSIRSPQFRKPLSKPCDFRNSSTFQTRRSFEPDIGPLYPLFSPRLTSTPDVSPLQEHSFVSPMPPTPRLTDHSLLSSPRHRRLGRRRLLFPSEDEEAVYYLITKYMLPMDDQYCVY